MGSQKSSSSSSTNSSSSLTSYTSSDLSSSSSLDSTLSLSSFGSLSLENDIPFTSAMALTQMGVPCVPERYVLPPSQRPDTSLTPSPDNSDLPVIDLSLLDDATSKSQLMTEIKRACKELGFFQVTNHGVLQSVMKGALDCASDFFNLPAEEKMKLGSGDVHTPVRYGTSVNHVKDEVRFWRDFIKHYSHPISDWVHLWPTDPPDYREKMGRYATALQGLQKKLTSLVFESLGIEPDYLREEADQNSQVLAVNCYPSCPEPEITLGMPPHSDYGTLTILLQSSPGLQIKNKKENWVSVPYIDGSLIVQLGDQMEVMSNGEYKSIVHRVTVSSDQNRFSIASLHSLALEKKIGPVPALVDDNHPVNYQEFSFNDFLNFIERNEITEGRFIDTLKM
ncbi:unnamed protein product [Rhodiola kirilowii]